MKSEILFLATLLFLVPAFGVPDQYDYEYPINVSDIRFQNADIDQRFGGSTQYTLNLEQNNTCSPITIRGNLTAPDSVSLVTVLGNQKLSNYEYQNEIRTDFDVDFKDQRKTGELVHNSKNKGSGAEGDTSLDFSRVGTNNTFEIQAGEVAGNCKSKTRTLRVTFQWQKFWDKFRINSIDVPEVRINQRFNVTINVTNPGNRPTSAPSNTIHSIGIGVEKKDINLSAGETRIVKIPYRLTNGTQDDSLQNRVEIEKKEPLVIQISNQRYDIVERKINLTVKDGREPLDDFDFTIKPENPLPGETFRLDVFTEEGEPINPDGKIQFIKNGNVLEEYTGTGVSTVSDFPSLEALDRKNVTYDSDSARVLDVLVGNPEIDSFEIPRRSGVSRRKTAEIVENYTEEGLLDTAAQARGKEVSVRKPSELKEIVEANKSVSKERLDSVTLKVTLNELDGKISESKRIEIANSKSGWLNAAYSLLFSGDWFIFG